ncbi:hypothetical protein Pmani_032263 [Petrolisthes manimaculis]|uniref:Metalloendopeptidase n=1 Tax=Petrolisthes manimaculis TaxID=1843537 RepID=A0AAE1TRU1_9EUCA|nr:hypothetical protein Pmani_032263 [Petrolisthes manimaculis]
MDPTFTRSERKMIKAAMRHIEHQTCIFFCRSHKPGLRKTLHITFGVGCSSKVGYRPLGTEIRLGVPCFVKVGTVVHELLHSLGLHHEHQRFDSRRYIKINFNCIQRGHERNFMPQSKTRVLSAGIPYDYNSILHYGQHTYSKKRSDLRTVNYRLSVRSVSQRDRHVHNAMEEAGVSQSVSTLTGLLAIILTTQQPKQNQGVTFGRSLIPPSINNIINSSLITASCHIIHPSPHLTTPTDSTSVLINPTSPIITSSPRNTHIIPTLT